MTYAQGPDQPEFTIVNLQDEKAAGVEKLKSSEAKAPRQEEGEFL